MMFCAFWPAGGAIQLFYFSKEGIREAQEFVSKLLPDHKLGEELFVASEQRLRMYDNWAGIFTSQEDIRAISADLFGKEWGNVRVH